MGEGPAGRLTLETWARRSTLFATSSCSAMVGGRCGECSAVGAVGAEVAEGDGAWHSSCGGCGWRNSIRRAEVTVGKECEERVEAVSPNRGSTGPAVAGLGASKCRRGAAKGRIAVLATPLRVSIRRWSLRTTQIASRLWRAAGVRFGDAVLYAESAPSEWIRSCRKSRHAPGALSLRLWPFQAARDAP